LGQSSVENKKSFQEPKEGRAASVGDQRPPPLTRKSGRPLEGHRQKGRPDPPMKDLAD